MDATEPDALDLGPGALPTDDGALATRLWDALTATAPDAGWHAARGLTARRGIEPDALESVRIDLTGLDIDASPADTAPADALHPSQPFAEVTAGVIRSFSLVGAPLRIATVPVAVRVDASDMPVEWVTDADARLWLRLATDRGDRLVASVRASVALPEAIAALRATLGRELASARLRLETLDADVRADRRGRIDASVRGRIRWGILSASARGSVRIRLRQSDMTATIEKVAVRSFNPFVALALLTARKELAAMEGTEHDLNATLPAGVRLTALRVERRRDDLVVEARIG